MSNYPNMSYCMCNNTVLAMRQIISNLSDDDEASDFIAELSPDEFTALQDVFSSCEDLLKLKEIYEDELENQNETY